MNIPTEAMVAALTKINNIRNSIIGFQTVNWSEHIYPLVAALEEAGIEGAGYPVSRENVGTMLERTLAAESALRMIVSHATMGHTDGEGQSVNDICVQITALRNELYENAKAAALQSLPPQSGEAAKPNVYDIGDNTMARVFKPAGLTNLHDLQAVFDAVEKAFAAAPPALQVKAETVAVDLADAMKCAAKDFFSIGHWATTSTPKYTPYDAFEAGWKAAIAVGISPSGESNGTATAMEGGQ